jgi:hypothetical protein
MLVVGGQASAGASFNVVPGSAWFSVDRRLIPTAASARAHADSCGPARRPGAAPVGGRPVDTSANPAPAPIPACSWLPALARPPGATITRSACSTMSDAAASSDPSRSSGTSAETNCRCIQGTVALAQQTRAPARANPTSSNSSSTPSENGGSMPKRFSQRSVDVALKLTVSLPCLTGPDVPVRQSLNPAGAPDHLDPTLERQPRRFCDSRKAESRQGPAFVGGGRGIGSV